MSRTERFALLGVAAVLALLAVVLLPRRDDNPGDRAAVTTTGPTPSAATPGPASSRPTSKQTPKPKPPLLVAGAKKQLTFTKDQTVRFRVRHDTAEEVHVHGYDISKDIPAGKTVTLSFKAGIEGIFEVELEHSATPLGTIRVEPK